MNAKIVCGPPSPYPHIVDPRLQHSMTVVTSGKVLVTGANGYIAVWLVNQLLEQGYSVRGTVRAASRGKYLTKLFEKYADKFELAIIEDITKVRVEVTSM